MNNPDGSGVYSRYDKLGRQWYRGATLNGSNTGTSESWQYDLLDRATQHTWGGISYARNLYALDDQVTVHCPFSNSTSCSSSSSHAHVYSYDSGRRLTGIDYPETPGVTSFRCDLYLHQWDGLAA